MAQVHSLIRLNDTLQAILPPTLVGQINCAKLEQGTLTLIAANGSYATQIKFSSEAIMAGLNEALTNQPIKSIRCIVRPPSAKKKVVNKPTRRISTAAAEGICATAATITNEKLRLIWQRLGRR